MKSLLILSIFCFSSLAFAVVPTELNELESYKVILAVRDSIKTNDLNCVAAAHGTKIKASDLDWKFFTVEEFKVSINDEDLAQPIIFMKKKFSGNSDVVVTVNTNEDMSVVTKMVIVQNEHKETEINVGSVLKPIYVNVTESKVVQTITCQ